MGEEKFSSDAPPRFLIRGRQNGDHPVFLRNDYDPGPLVDRISSFFSVGALSVSIAEKSRSLSLGILSPTL
jgi:hypothetical protein